MIVLNADPTTFLTPKLPCVWKSVVMESDTLRPVMMVTTLMAMGAAGTVTSKSDSHAMEGHHPLKIHARPFSHRPSQSKTEDSQDFTERSFSTSDSTTCQVLFLPQPMIARTTARVC